MAASTWSTTDKTASVTLTGGNLIATSTGSSQGIRGKDPKLTGKYYIEYTLGPINSVCSFGFAVARTQLGSASNAASSFSVTATSGNNSAYDYFANNIPGMGSQSPAPGAGSLICAAIDLDAARIWFRVGAAGNWNNNVANNPATAVGGLSLSGTGIGKAIDAYPFAYLAASTHAVTANFGGSAFTGAVPAGFTSGWDDSVAIVTNVVATQVAVEEWASVAAAVPGSGAQAIVMVMA